MINFFDLFSVDTLYIVLGLAGVSLITLILAIVALCKAAKLNMIVRNIGLCVLSIGYPDEFILIIYWLIYMRNRLFISVTNWSRWYRLYWRKNRKFSLPLSSR